MCNWIPFDGKNFPPSDREVLVYILNDPAVYFAFCEISSEEEECRWHIEIDGEFHIIETEEVLLYLEYPMIPKEIMEKLKEQE